MGGEHIGQAIEDHRGDKQGLGDDVPGQGGQSWPVLAVVMYILSLCKMSLAAEVRPHHM